MWFRFHFTNGQAPVQIFAVSQDAARAILRAKYGDVPDIFVGSGPDPMAGYQTISGTGNTPPGGGGAPPGGNVPPDVIGGLEQQFPIAAYRQGLQRQGIPQSGVFSRYLDSMYQPTAATFKVGQALGTIPDAFGGDQENAFRHYVHDSPIGGARQRATEAFWQLNQNIGSDNPALESYRDPYAEARTGGTEDEDAVSQLMALAGQTAATKYSPFAARSLFNPGRIKDRYEASGFQGNLLDWLKKSYGL